MAIPYAPSRLYQPDSSIIDIILQSGREKAQLQRASGQNWGNAVSNLGQIASNTIRDIAERKRQEPIEAAKLKQTQNQTELTSLQLGETKKQAERQARRDEAMKLPHRQEALAALQGDPEGQANAAKTFGQMDDYYDSMMGEAAAGIARSGFAPQAFDIALKDLEAKGIDKAKIAEYRQIISSDPAQAKALTYQLLSNSPNSKHQAIFAEEQARGLKNLDLEYQRSKDAKTEADRIADNVRADKLAAETGRHNRVMETRPTGSSVTRDDRIFQQERTVIDKLAAPIEERAARAERLVEAVNARTPAADALIAPELLTVMAGGMGSGLRMSEAELEKIRRGRSRWEDLTAAVQKWNPNSGNALEITDSQRAQIKDLIEAVNAKSKARLDLINGARSALIDSQDPKVSRTITADLRKKLSSFDGTERADPAGSNPLTVIIQGKTVTFQSKAQLDAWKKAAGVK